MYSSRFYVWWCNCNVSLNLIDWSKNKYIPIDFKNEFIYSKLTSMLKITLQNSFLENFRLNRQQNDRTFNRSFLNKWKYNHKMSIYRKTINIWSIILCRCESSQNGFRKVIFLAPHVITFAQSEVWRTIISGYLATSQISGHVHVMRLIMYDGNINKKWIWCGLILTNHHI